VTFGVVQIIVAVSMIFITISSSAYACKAVCCRKTKIESSVVFSAVNVDGQQVTISDLQNKAIPLGANGFVLPLPTAVSQGNSIGKFSSTFNPSYLRTVYL
jgi:hypothetical protein